MNPKMKNAKVTVKTSVETGDLIFTFRESLEKGEKFDAEKHDTYGAITFNRDKLSDEIIKEAIMHGLKQKLADALAWTKEDKATRTVQDAIDALDALWKQLEGGDWNAKTKGGSKAPTVKLSDMETKLLQRVSDGLMSLEDAKSFYADLTGKELNVPEGFGEEPENEKSDEETELN